MTVTEPTGKRVVFRQLHDHGFGTGIMRGVDGLHTVEAPAFAKILNFAEYRGGLVVWMLVDEVMPVVEYKFRLAVTLPSDETRGLVPADPGTYIGTVEHGFVSAYHLFFVDPRDVAYHQR